MKKISIVGNGYVGSAYVKFFEGYYDIKIYDPNYKRSNTKDEVNECEYAVICVPTNMKKDGSCDTSIVEETVKWLEVPHILIKSTIPPGTTKRLSKKYKKNLVFSPEYIGESSYFTPPWKYLHPQDARQHNFVILGGDDSNEWVEIFKIVLGPDAHYLQTNSTTAEMVKYGENSWGGTKVIFFNEFWDICQTFGVNFDEFRELLLYDPRIERMHTAVFRDKRGFGGKCFPKDINAIVHASKKAGYTPKLLEQVLKNNKRCKTKS